MKLFITAELLNRMDVTCGDRRTIAETFDLPIPVTYENCLKAREAGLDIEEFVTRIAKSQDIGQHCIVAIYDPVWGDSSAEGHTSALVLEERKQVAVAMDQLRPFGKKLLALLDLAMLTCLLTGVLDEEVFCCG